VAADAVRNSVGSRFQFKLAVDRRPPYYPWVDAIPRTDPTFEKMVLMLSATPGITAPAATATNPAIRAYSIKSCPDVFINSRTFNINFFIVSFLLLPR
jgi:hypothetical protein